MRRSLLWCAPVLAGMLGIAVLPAVTSVLPVALLAPGTTSDRSTGLQSAQGYTYAVFSTNTRGDSAVPRPPLP